MNEETEEQGQEEKEEQENEIKIQTPFLITESGIAEMVWDRQNSPLFAVRKFGSDNIEYVGQITTDQVDTKGRKIIYVPVDNSHLRKGLVIVPERAEPASFDEIFQDGFELVRSMYDFASEKEREDEVKLLVAITQASWFLDRMMPQQLQLAGIGVYAPIIAIRGRSGSGKNRLLNALRLQSYRPFYDQTTVRIPSIYRPLDLWRGTLCLDEADVMGNETNELVKLLNCRATGTPISRQNPDQPKISEAFFNFGLTIVTQRRAWQDDALENRSIPFYSEKTQKELSTVELDEWVERGIKLQNKLLYLRLLYWDQIAIDKSARIPGVRDHRLTASVLPLLALSKFAPSITQDLADILLEIERKRKEVRAQSTDGVIVNVIWDYIERGLVGAWNGLTYVGKEKVRQDKEEEIVPLSTSDLAEQLNWKSRQVRSVIHSLQLGAGPQVVKIGGKSYRPIWFTPKNLESVLNDFVPDYIDGSLANVFANFGITVTEVTQVTDNISLGLSDKGSLENRATESISVTSVTSVTEDHAQQSSTKGDRSDSDRPPVLPQPEPLCPPWMTTEAWEKLSLDEKLRVLKGGRKP